MERIELETERDILIANQAHEDGYNSGQMHSKPSKDTINLFKDMGEEINEIKIEMAKHGEHIGFIRGDIKEIKSDIKDFIKSAGEKFDKKANKEDLEKTDRKFTKFQLWVYGSIITSLTAIIVFLVGKIWP